MKNISKKIFLSVGVLCLAVVAFATTTFAWFTLSTTAKVNQFNMTIQTSSDLLARVALIDQSKASGDTGYVVATYPTADSYSTNITLGTDAITWMADNTHKLVALTSTNFANFYEMGAEEATANAKKAGYYLFRFDFRSNKAGAVVVRTITDSDDPSVPVSFTTQAAFKGSDALKTSHSANANTTGKGAAAMRLSFMSTGTSTDATSFFVCQKGKYEGDYLGAYDDELAAPNNTGNSALNYYNAINSTSLLVPEKYQKLLTTDGTYGKQSKLLTTQVAEDGVTQNDGTPTSIVSFTQVGTSEVYTASVFMNVWLEGWDADCYNAILNAVIQLGIEFQVKTA